MSPVGGEATVQLVLINVMIKIIINHNQFAPLCMCKMDQKSFIMSQTFVICDDVPPSMIMLSSWKCLKSNLFKTDCKNYIWEPVIVFSGRRREGDSIHSA